MEPPHTDPDRGADPGDADAMVGWDHGGGAAPEAAMQAQQAESPMLSFRCEGVANKGGGARPTWRKAASAQLAIRGFLHARVQVPSLPPPPHMCGLAVISNDAGKIGADVKAYCSQLAERI